MTEYTILEAARLLGITKNQAKYRLKSVPEAEIHRADDGKIYVTAAGLDWLRNRAEKTTDKPVLNHEEPVETGSEPVLNDHKPVSATEETGFPDDKPVDKPVDAGIVAALQAAVDLLGQQLAEKDRQIEEKDRQIKAAQQQAADLTRQIAAVTQALQTAQDQAQAAQALHAGTIQKQLLESSAGAIDAEEAATAAPESKPKRRRWWQWWVE